MALAGKSTKIRMSKTKEHRVSQAYGSLRRQGAPQFTSNACQAESRGPGRRERRTEWTGLGETQEEPVDPRLGTESRRFAPASTESGPSRWFQAPSFFGQHQLEPCHGRFISIPWESPGCGNPPTKMPTFFPFGSPSSTKTQKEYISLQKRAMPHARSTAHLPLDPRQAIAESGAGRGPGLRIASATAKCEVGFFPYELRPIRVPRPSQGPVGRNGCIGGRIRSPFFVCLLFWGPCVFHSPGKKKTCFFAGVLILA